jgi:hypothetical protein
MRRLLILGVLLLAGCETVRGPLQPREPQRVDDPRYSIPEQERRGRDRLAVPDETKTVAPQIPGINVPQTIIR